MAYGDSVILKRESDGKTLSIDDQGRVNVVVASGDIQIGALEIKDATSENRAVVNVLGQLGVSGDQRIRDATSATYAKVYPTGQIYVSGDALVQLVDGTINSRKATVFPAGQVYVSGDVNLVNADIEIGAVELKDGDSDTRADVETDGTKNALYVQANNLDVRDLLPDDKITVAGVTVPLGISGDVSTLPKAGQVWPVVVNKIYDSIDVSGDVSVTVTTIPNISISKIYDAIDVSGDVTVSSTNLDIRDLALTDIVSIGKIYDAVDVSGDVTVSSAIVTSLPNVSIGKIYDSIDISGDVSASITSLPNISISKIYDSIDVSGDVTVSGTVAVSSVTTLPNISIAKIYDSIDVSGDVNVRLEDGISTQKATVFSTGALRVSGDRLPSGNGDYGTITLTATAAVIVVGRPDLKQVMFSPAGTIYFASDASVLSTTGVIMYSGDAYTDSGEGVYTGDIYGITGGGSVGVRWNRKW